MRHCRRSPIEKLTVSPEPASNELLLSDRLLITRSGRDGATIVNAVEKELLPVTTSPGTVATVTPML